MPGARRVRRGGWLPRPALAITAVVATYAFAEGVTSLLHARGLLEPHSVWLHERTDPRGNIRFDPVRGSRLSSRAARIACIASNGSVETVGLYRGNNHGFPDRDDFQPSRPDRGTRRLAVFGDSFSHAQFLETNWPDRAEDLARSEGQRLQLLNLSLDGVGLANWASVLSGYVAPRGYELDGAIFAVWGADLSRPFAWWMDAPRGARGQPEEVLLGAGRRWSLEYRPTSATQAAADSPRGW